MCGHAFVFTLTQNYDIFGDVLTEAMLMESATQPDIVSVSPSVYNVCKDVRTFVLILLWTAD